MQVIAPHSFRIIIVAFLTIGLIVAPVGSKFASAQDRGAGANDVRKTRQPTIGSDVAAGVDVTGPSGKVSRSGKGALAPPPKGIPQVEPPPVQHVQQKPQKKGIGASAGPVGSAGMETGSGISMGWKITGGVLGLGLLLGLAGGSGGSGGGTTGGHE